MDNKSTQKPPVPMGYNQKDNMKGSVDGASKMKPIIGNRKPSDPSKKK